jgi:hypothetical protein
LYRRPFSFFRFEKVGRASARRINAAGAENGGLNRFSREAFSRLR